MRRVLVDDDDAVGGLGDDVGLMHLRARGTQRIGLRGGRRLRFHARGRAIQLRRQRRERGHGLRRQSRRGTAAARREAAPRRHRGGELRRNGEGAQRIGGHRGRRAMSRRRQRLADRGHDQAAHQGGVAEPHLGLGRMHIHVDLFRRQIDEQSHHRMAVTRQEVLIGAADGADDEPVFHRAAVHEQELLGRGGPVQGRQSGEAGQAHALAQRIQPRRIVGEVAAHDGTQALQARCRLIFKQVGCDRRQAQRQLLLVAQGEGDVGMRHRQALQRILHGIGFRARRFQELKPRRHRIEQVAQFDPRAVAAAPPVPAWTSGHPRPRSSRRCPRRACGWQCSNVRLRQWRAAPRRGNRRNGYGQDRHPAVSRSHDAPPPEIAPRATCRCRHPRPRSATGHHRADARRSAAAPASSAFSTSSFTTEAGRSTTSPAAIWFTRLGGRRRIVMVTSLAFKACDTRFREAAPSR